MTWCVITPIVILVMSWDLKVAQYHLVGEFGYGNNNCVSRSTNLIIFFVMNFSWDTSVGEI